MILSKVLCITFAVCIPFLAQSQTEPLRDPSRLYQAVPETVLAVGTARVIVADYDLIRADFKQTRNMSTSQINQWLLSHTAYISKQQAAQEVVNTKISLTGAETIAHRPYEYRRGLVFDVEGGLIDSKGNGSVDPSPGGHSNGLASLGSMIREFIYERLVREIFKVADPTLKTVANYAVIDFGFDIKTEDGKLIRAGTILRQAHRRNQTPGGKLRHANNPNQASMLPVDTQIRVETILRKFGMTSAGAYRSTKKEDRLNIQGSVEGAVVDFGSFLVIKDFFTKAVNYWSEYFAFEAPLWSAAESPQPNENFRLPWHIWGFSESGKEEPNYDNPQIYSDRLA